MRSIARWSAAEQQLAQRQQANDTQTNELRIKTEQALATVHQSDSQVAQLEGKLADAQAAQQALQQQYADLARNRDDWTLAEVGQMLSAASQQLQLTGNTQLALFALQSADTRLAASDSPQAVAVRKAIAQDIDKLKAAPSTDLTGHGDQARQRDRPGRQPAALRRSADRRMPRRTRRRGPTPRRWPRPPASRAGKCGGMR